MVLAREVAGKDVHEITHGILGHGPRFGGVDLAKGDGDVAGVRHGQRLCGQWKSQNSVPAIVQ
jgi:hypothetical protein